MSRPTKETQQQQAEAWMLKTFGHRLGDYLTKQQQEPLSVAIVEVDRILKASGARKLLAQCCTSRGMTMPALSWVTIRA